MRRLGLLLVLAVMLALAAPPADALAPAAPVGAPAARSDRARKSVDLDVLFVSAHPDDEASSLATLGQWEQRYGVKAGVVTVTRGEGGGNAVGLEEGPPLGIIREREERAALGKAGVQNLYNLDRVDFWYTASAPLSEQIWGHDDTLGKIVRVIRTTRPEVIMTMNPSPIPGNHGNHQQAARFAAEAFRAAADPKAYPEQLRSEGLSVFRPAKLLRNGSTGTSEPGPGCASSFRPSVPTDQVFGVWEGIPAGGGKTWAQVEVEARREYVTQGWATTTAAAPTDPAAISCDFYTLVDSRVPYDPSDTSPTSILRGSVLPSVRGGLPRGTELYLTTDTFDVTPGRSFQVTAHIRAARGSITAPRVTLRVPDGWTVREVERHPRSVPAGRERTVRFTVTAPAGARTGVQKLLTATLTTRGQGTGRTDEAVRVVADVRGTLEALPEVAAFRTWASTAGYGQLDTLIKPVLPIGSGRSREVAVELRNDGTTTQSGTVTLHLPAGFGVDATTKSYTALAPGMAGRVSFTVTNTDATLATANEGGVDGDYDLSITTTSTAGRSVETGALEIVPTTAIPRAGAGNAVDGVLGQGEYTGPELDFSRIWEGEAVTPKDASATGHVAWTDRGLQLIVQVSDDVLGRKVVPQDCKRQRRTDSVEIIVDPSGNSANTSTVFKAGIFPITADPAHGNPPCWQRDADNRQGPAAQTAPGMKVVSKVSKPYAGYTIETFIPFDVLPDAVDPQHLGLNVLVYDSDTQDLSSQSRLGWSTYAGVRADPYRYGLATLPGYQPAARTASAPVLPDTAARSVHSPQTIAQSVRDRVAPAAVAALPRRALTVSRPRTVRGGVEVTVRADRRGTVDLYAWDGSRSLGDREIDLRAGRPVNVRIPVATGTPVSVLAAFETGAGALAKEAKLR